MYECLTRSLHTFIPRPLCMPETICVALVVYNNNLGIA